MLKPPHINESHWNEWVIDSVVDPELTSLNVVSLSGMTPYDRLLYALPTGERRNDGRVRNWVLRRYAHTEHGGWWCNGVDVLTGNESQWGTFKPDEAKQEIEYNRQGHFKKAKLIKYEHPLKTETEIFALSVPLHLWKAIALRYDVPLPENIVVTPFGRALGFWAWVIANPSIPLIITEGAKKAGAIITAGYVAIALPGIYNGYRQLKNDWGQKIGNPHLIPQLKAFAHPDRKIIFCFDHDQKPKTATNVSKAIATTGKLFERQGCSVDIITWNSPEKGVDDLIANKGVDYFHALIQNRIPLSKFNLASLLDLSNYDPLYVNERYLSENLTPPEDAQVIGIKSPKGTGKTEWLAKIVERATRVGQRVIIICHREQLAIALADRFGVDYRTEVRTSVTKGLFGYALCIDSLHPHANPPFNPSEWQNALVIIDEAEQVFWHLLNSRTCERNRIAIIESFKQLLLTAVGTGSKVYLADADLSPIALDYVRSLIGFPVKTWVVENQYKPKGGKRKLITYSGNDPRELVAALVNHISRGQRVLIHTTGQKAKSKWGSINLESYLSKLFPDLSILRIDSESVAEPEHRAYGCIGNLNAILPLYDIVICSPVVETGVSIDLKGHFDSVWCIAQGIQTVDAVCQAIHRLRDGVPRHIWVKTTAKGNRIGNGSTNIKGLLASTHKLAVANISLLQQASIDEFEELEVNSSPESLNTWAKRACVVNAGLNNYRAEIIAKLRDEGYKISNSETEDSQGSNSVNDDLKQTRTENYQQYCQAVVQVDTPSEKELESLSNKRAKTQTERLVERKGNLIKKYGVSVTPDLVEKDDRGWYPQLQLHYYLTIGNAYLAQRDRRSLAKISEQGDGKAFKPDINKRQLSAKIKALQIIQVEQFFDPEAEFTKETLTEWLDFVIDHRFDIKSILGVSINPDKDSAIAVAQRILKKLGLKLEFKCWRGDRSSKQRIYSGCNLNPDERERVFDNWLAREEKMYDHDPVHTLL
ncbi:MAG: DUF3854 domain-containing protein [Xenococcus sp. MO_188.B8]|nr:DUF3854 domain-containing protein [Xenococcus sp. MO_188.B8]